MDWLLPPSVVEDLDLDRLGFVLPVPFPVNVVAKGIAKACACERAWRFNVGPVRTLRLLRSTHGLVPQLCSARYTILYCPSVCPRRSSTFSDSWVE